MSRQAELDCKVYVGDLPRDVSEKELEKLFSEYGRLRKVWVARNPPGFAFVEFEDPRDADDSIRALDGLYKFGNRIRVEPSSGKSKPKPWQRDGGGRGRGPPRYDSYSSRGPPRGKPFDPRDKCYKCGESGHYAYDCNVEGGGGGGGRYGGHGRSRSRSPRDYRGGERRRRSYSRSRSRSRSMDRMPRRSRSGSRN